MKKGFVFIIIGLAIVGILLVVGINFYQQRNVGENEIVETIKIESAEDLSALIDEIYSTNTNLYPSLTTQIIDVTDSETVKYMTGLENGENLEYLLVSEPMMSSQAYSLVIGKVKQGINANSVAEEMFNNIDTRKWICVSAEAVYATSHNDIVFLVMSSQEIAKPVYDTFKGKAKNVAEEFYKKEEAIETEELPVMY